MFAPGPKIRIPVPAKPSKRCKVESRLTATDIYCICMSNGWFTCGDNQQYTRVMRAADNGMDMHDLAVAIWICSDAIQLEDIEGKIADYLRWEKPQRNGGV